VVVLPSVGFYFFLCFVVFLLFYLQSGRFTGERRFIILSFSPLSYGLLRLFMVSVSCRGDSQGDVFLLTLVLPSLNRNPSFLFFEVFQFCAFSCFAFGFYDFMHFSVLTHFDIFTKWGPMV